MDSNEIHMDPMQESALYETANIGLGHATTSLSDLTGHRFNMSIPSIETVVADQLADRIGSAESVAMAVFMPVSGDIDGYMAFLFPWSSARALIGMLTGFDPESWDMLGELESSAILEVGNIINSSYLNAISDMTGLSLHATPPYVAIDMAGAVINGILAQAESRESIALTIETKLFCESAEAHGFFLYLPSLIGIKLLFEKLGIAEAA